MTDEDRQTDRIDTAFAACRSAGHAVRAAGFRTQESAIMVAYVAEDEGGVFSIHGSMPAAGYGLAWAKVQALEELRADVWRQALATGDPPQELLDGLLAKVRDGGMPLDLPEPERDDLAERRIWKAKANDACRLTIVFVGPGGDPRVEYISMPDDAELDDKPLRRGFDMAATDLRELFEPTDDFDPIPGP